MRLLLLFTLLVIAAGDSLPFRRVCYMPPSASYPVTSFTANDTHLCTHVLLCGVAYNNGSVTYGGSPDIIPYLKSLRKTGKFKLSVVHGASSAAIVQILNSTAQMHAYASAVASFLMLNDLDGIDLDWEFPSIEQKPQVGALLPLIRVAFEAVPRPMLLSMAVGGGVIIPTCYDVPAMNKYLDFMSLMGYDLWFYKPELPLTGHQSALYPWSAVPGFDLANDNSSLNLFVELGFLDSSKVVLGLPSYAHVFHLADKSLRGLLAPAKQFDAEVPLSVVCDFVKQPDVNVTFDKAAQASYASNATHWLTYDTFTAVKTKVEYVKDRGYGGVMVWCLSDDFDPKQRCGTARYPVHEYIYNLTLSHSTATYSDEVYISPEH